MEGRKVALVEIQAEPTARSIIETSLVNQLVKRGTFLLVPKQEIDAARSSHQVDNSDPAAVAKAAGADYALKAEVLKFEADTREGYSDEEVEDSQLAEERGDDGKTRRLYKVKAMTGDVQIRLEFLNLKTGDLRTGVAEKTDRVEAEARTSSAHLPPKIRFLERLSNEAFHEFFERYQ